MSIDYYNTRIRQAISDEYVKCSKQREEYAYRYGDLTTRLINERDTLLHTEYIQICEERDELVRLMRIEDIKLDIWDQAREICLNIADEMEETK